jgi:hypothetical protein
MGRLRNFMSLDDKVFPAEAEAELEAELEAEVEAEKEVEVAEADEVEVEVAEADKAEVDETEANEAEADKAEADEVEAEADKAEADKAGVVSCRLPKLPPTLSPLSTVTLSSSSLLSVGGLVLLCSCSETMDGILGLAV